MNGLSKTTLKDDQAVRDVRKLVIDICRQNNGGHGGSAIGMAPMAVALWRHTMRYNPLDALWFDRDRFVLSNGHASILLYAMLHIAGYPHMTMDELKLYGSAKTVDRKTGRWPAIICHAHPEIEVHGVEVTTGPLGQGVANAVGLAIASKNLAGTFNKPDAEIISSRIYCITGDGCIQEGVANEAIALAGHLELDNLVLLYDNNAVTCDGPVDWIVSEDTNAKMRSMGWNVVEVLEGDTSVAAIAKALADAKSVKGKPTFINIHTTIGFGTSTAGTFKSHHGTYTDDDAGMYTSPGEAASHAVTKMTKDYFCHVVTKGQELHDSWKDMVQKYSAAYPSEAEALKSRMQGNFDTTELLTAMPAPDDSKPTRQANGIVFSQLFHANPSIVAGGADLWNSTQIMAGQDPSIFGRDHPDGRVIRYGIREHAMAAISNGIAAYSPGCFLPITSTFFMFFLYAAPAVRMGALSDLKVIHVATHDSIGEGQNGPTHQPVELDSLFRAMPKLRYLRPADGEEVIGAWLVALGPEALGPSIISLARDPPPYAVENTDRHKVRLGGYVVLENEEAVVTLVSCGSDLAFTVQAARNLTSGGIPSRVVSMPCIGLFEQQHLEYQDAVLSKTKHVISVEAYVSSMWARFCTASVAMDSYGYSGAGRENFARFGLDVEGIVKKVRGHVTASDSDSASRPSRWRLLK